MNHGIYIHIPFCRKKCSYCSFYSVTLCENAEKALIDSYIAALTNDIEGRLMGKEPVPVDTIYFGGGTPSILSGSQISGIIDTVRKCCIVNDDTEISLELNPEDAKGDKLLAYTDAGVNRIVLGYQTSKEGLHSFIGRGTGPCKEEMLDLYFKTDGFIHCIDVITGIPGQSLEDLEEELNLVTAYGPEHISVYQLTIEEGTPLKERYSPDEKFDDHQRNAMEKTIAVLKGKGYDHYEISNFALNGSYSRHNMKYWSWMPYIGFGPRSHSYFQDIRYFTDMTVHDYIESKEIVLTEDDRGPMASVVEYILTGLRLMKGISIPELEGTLSVSLPEKVWASIRKEENLGNIAIESLGGDTTIKLTKNGLYIANSVIYNIVEEIL